VFNQANSPPKGKSLSDKISVDKIISESVPVVEEKNGKRRDDDQELEELLSRNPQTLEIKRR
jgi:hypothetical protein